MSDDPAASEQERKVMDFYEAYQARHGRPPAVREVGAHLGLPHPNNAIRVIRRLEDAGRLTKGGGARAFRLTGAPGLTLPLRGLVSCGPGVEAEDPGERLDLTALFGRDDLAVFEAVGTSMLDAGIIPGDYVVVKEDPDPPSGATVVVMLDRDMLCKRLKRNRKSVRLESRSSGTEPITVDPGRGYFRFLGVFHSLIRRA